jgi:hypothetical protein
LDQNPDPWWGYSLEYGWVVLDNQHPNNGPESRRLHLLRCRDWVEVILDPGTLCPPAYIPARLYIDSYASVSRSQLLDEFQACRKEFVRRKQEAIKRRQIAELAKAEQNKRIMEKKQASGKSQINFASSQRQAASR